MPEDTADIQPTDQPQPESKAVDDDPKKKIEDQFQSRIEAAKSNRRSMHAEWKRNVELRMGQVASVYTGGVAVEDDVKTEINPDWSLTKTKTANLYSQVPTVQGTHENKQYAAAVPPFIKALNYEIGEKRANIGVAMEEVLNDVVNAAGVGAVHVGYIARFDEVRMPVEQTIPHPDTGEQVLTKQIPLPHLEKLEAAGVLHLKTTKAQTDYKFFATRISPSNLLWPADFAGSNFDDGDFIGESDKLSWPEAQVAWDLDDEEKETLVNKGETNSEDDLRTQPEKAGVQSVPYVRFDRLYYWRYRVDKKEKFFKSIWEIVYVDGKKEPVKHEQWSGQRVENGKLIGATKFPIRVCTLTYITDNPVPPSDSAAGRPQVNDLRRSRSQMFMQRERSIPVRGFDVNSVDPLIQDSLMKGTYQGWIPMNGRRQDAIWEVARASYPSEDLTFDQNTMADLEKLWQVNPLQMGGSAGKQTTGTSNLVQQNFATRIGQERGRFAYFFLSCCEVLAGLMALYSDFPSLTDQEKQQMQQAWDGKKILHDLVFKIRPDSQIVLDTNQQLERLFKFLNMTVKSGFVNPKPIIVQIAELSGLDPTDIIIDPKPPKPDDPTISHRFTGKDDLMSPAVLSIISQHGGLPGEDHLEKAKQFLKKAAEPPQEAPSQAGAAAGPGAPGAHPPAPGGPPGQRLGMQPGQVGRPDAHPQWTAGSRVIKRSRDMSSSGG